ncbi:MAG: Cys-tRNA(Pro) deacylase [Streptosporangiales bacterium]|nr:Cys-tRNA(Pro) deacylase [Streptosporangiales bacterium]
MTRKADKKGGKGTPATIAATRGGAAFSLHPYTADGTSESYGAEAADALGVPHERIFKTLVAEVDGALVVAVVPVAGSLDLKALAAAAGGKRATMADPAAAERSSGYVRGGISPLGQRKPLPTVVDATAYDFPTIYVSAGRRGLQMELSPADLAKLTNATTAPIARP